jgi:hypothetical protein
MGIGHILKRKKIVFDNILILIIVTPRLELISMIECLINKQTIASNHNSSIQHLEKFYHMNLLSSQRSVAHLLFVWYYVDHGYAM